MGPQFFSVAGPLDDDLEAGGGQPVQRAFPENEVIKEAEPFLHAAVAGDDEAAWRMSATYSLNLKRHCPGYKGRAAAGILILRYCRPTTAPLLSPIEDAPIFPNR